MKSKPLKFYIRLGWMTRGGPFGNPKVDGLTGKECNPTNFTDPNSPLICVNDQAIDECPYDPGIMDN
jgi:hypothetical protein